MQEKMLERGVNGNIMQLMCSRECYSVSRSRLIAGLLVFLAAFLVGISAVSLVRSVLTIFLPDTEITSLRRSVCPIVVRRHTPGQDVEPLAVEYDGAVTDPFHLMESGERFRLTNLGSEQIYFELNDSERMTAHISDAGGFFNADVPFRVPVQKLSPGDSTYGFASVPIDAKNYELSIDYVVGDRHVRRNSTLSSAEESY